MATEVATREWLVRCPNKDYAGFTANVEFFHGKAVVNDETAADAGFFVLDEDGRPDPERPDPERLARTLVTDFGYTATPPLEPLRPAGQPSRGLAAKFDEVRASENTGPFCVGCGTRATATANYCASCGTPIMRIEDSNRTSPAPTRDPREMDPARVVPFFPPEKGAPAGSDANERLYVSHDGRDPNADEVQAPDAQEGGEAAPNGDTHG